jgi:hypothetical protein
MNISKDKDIYTIKNENSQVFIHSKRMELQEEQNGSSKCIFLSKEGRFANTKHLSKKHFPYSLTLVLSEYILCTHLID